MWKFNEFVLTTVRGEGQDRSGLPISREAENKANSTTIIMS